jgi:hypothetical protein
VSDIPQAPDWWQASDGKWYPPQAGQGAPDPFQQMQQGTTVPGSSMPTGVTFGGIPGYNQGTGKGCMSLWVIITVATLVIGGAITAVVLFTVDDAVDNANDIIDDTFQSGDEVLESVEVTCGRAQDPLNSATATVEVTNDGDGTATYFIDVVFESRNGNRQFGTGSVIVSGLEPGNTASEETGGIIDVPEGQRFDCRPTNARRTETG